MPPLILAFLLMGLNASMAALDAVFVRLVSGEVHAFQIAFFRNLFSLVALLFILRGQARNFDAKGMWPIHSLRAVIKLLALVAYFLAITQLPIAQVTAIAFTMPLFVMMGSVLFLQERLNFPRIAALLVGLVGMLVILQPSGLHLGLGVALAVGSAIGLATVALLMKVSSSQEDPLRIVWFNLLVTVPLAGVLAIPFWVWPSAEALGFMALQGVGGLLAQLSIARAMKLADASVIIAADFIRLPVAAVLGLLIFSEFIESAVIAGGALIFSGVLFSAWAEHRKAR